MLLEHFIYEAGHDEYWMPPEDIVDTPKSRYSATMTTRLNHRSRFTGLARAYFYGQPQAAPPRAFSNISHRFGIAIDLRLSIRVNITLMPNAFLVVHLRSFI